MSPAVGIWSLGHSDRSWQELRELLEDHGIRCLVDVRRYPRSRRHPQFAAERLASACVDAELAYEWLGESLGGYRSAEEVPEASAAELAGIEGAGFRRYAAHLRSADALQGLTRLRHLATTGRTAMMCAEREPARCHRRLIADVLVVLGHEVRHIIDAGEVREHEVPAGVRVEEGRLIYMDPQRLPGF